MILCPQIISTTEKFNEAKVCTENKSDPGALEKLFFLQKWKAREMRYLEYESLNTNSSQFQSTEGQKSHYSA